MKNRILPLGLLSGFIFSGCASFSPPPTTTRAPCEGKGCEATKQLADACDPTVKNVDTALRCATLLQQQYTSLALKLHGEQGVSDGTLMGTGFLAGGVSSYAGNIQIIRGLGLIGASLLGVDSYSERRKLARVLTGGAQRLQCITQRGSTIKTLAIDHAGAMALMQNSFKKLEQTTVLQTLRSAERQVLADTYLHCKSSESAQLAGGYSNYGAVSAYANTPVASATPLVPVPPKFDETKVTAQLMTAVHQIDSEVFNAYFALERKADNAKAFAENVKRREKELNLMVEKAEAAKAINAETPVVVAGMEPAAAASAKTEAVSEAAKKAADAADSARKLLDLITDLDACILDADSAP